MHVVHKVTTQGPLAVRNRAYGRWQSLGEVGPSTSPRTSLRRLDPSPRRACPERRRRMGFTGVAATSSRLARDAWV